MDTGGITFNARLGVDANKIAILVAIFSGVFLPPMFILLGIYWRDVQEKARERRLAENKMNARLLRFDI